MESPIPKSFLKAADKVACKPSQCVVFEDSLHGIEAGLKGGMKVVAVATTHPQDRLSSAHKVVERSTEIDLPALQSLFTSYP